MLRTNSKKAVENIRAYIMGGIDVTNYPGTPEPENFTQAARLVLGTFRREKYSSAEDRRYYGNSESRAFEDWCSGLPSILDTCYYYNRSAVNDLGNILEQTESERRKYSEDAAEKMLTSLIYREIIKEA